MEQPACEIKNEPQKPPETGEDTRYTIYVLLGLIAVSYAAALFIPMIHPMSETKLEQRIMIAMLPVLIFLLRRVW